MSSDIANYLYPSGQSAYAEQRNRMIEATTKLNEDANARALSLKESLAPVSGETGNDGLISGPAGSRIQNFLAMLEEYMAGAESDGDPKATYDENGIPLTFFGTDGNDTIHGYDNLIAAGGAGNDTITGYRNLYALGGDGDDHISGYDNVQAAGNNGNDHIEGYDNLRASGGNGNDRISGYDNMRAEGGNGDDIIDGYDNAIIGGGAGNDRIDTYDNAVIDAGSGDDRVSVYSNATITLGDGDDDAYATGKNNRVDGGEGNDRIRAGINAVVNGGTGNDYITADHNSLIDGGDGDDKIMAAENALVNGGAGDDYIRVGRDSTVLYNKGDGLDALDSSVALSASTVQFGPDISVADLNIEKRGDHLVINIGDTGDGIVIRNAIPGNIPTLSFNDGSTMSGGDIAAAAHINDAPVSGRLAAVIAYEGVGHRVNPLTLSSLNVAPAQIPE